MAEHIRSGKHDVQKQPDWNHGKMTEQLSEHLQSQSLDESDNEPKRPMSLLQLPLVLVRQILQDLVQCYATPQNQTVKLLSLLDLRRVHRFFDAEVTWLLGRDLERWDKANRTACLYRAPTPFIIRILEGCIGDRDRGGCEFATQMHSVVDTLVEQFEQLGSPRERDQMLHAVCHAFATRPWQREMFRWRSAGWNTHCWSNNIPKRWNPKPTAFAVALHAGYDDVIKNMLNTIHAVPCENKAIKKWRLAAAESLDFGLPLDMAVATGRMEQIELLWAHGAQLGHTNAPSAPFSFTALEVAARRGHQQVLELVIPRLFPDKIRGQDPLEIVGKVLRMAARHRQWHIVRPLVEEYSQLMKFHMQEYLYSTLCIAARYGIDEMVSVLLGCVESSTSCFPLRDAAGGGHLSTCKLLLWEGPRPEQLTIIQQSEVFARAVARGGNVEVCKLLRPHFFWRDCHEIHFLPIAAEHGHLEFAKYAVANRCDRNPPAKQRASVILDLDRKVRYPDDIRYFALLRAIISGHEEVIRWMVNDLGVDIGPDAKLIHPGLDPWQLATHANTFAKLRLAVGLDVELEVRDCGKDLRDCQETAIETLDAYQRALRLRKDYSRNWYKHRVSDF